MSDSASVISRSNSDLLNIKGLADDVNIPVEVRMELILKVVEDWSYAVMRDPLGRRAKRVAPQYLAARNKRIAAEYKKLMAAKTATGFPG